MAGSITGGKKAAVLNKQRYGDDFYRIQGKKGGAAHNKGGWNDRELAAKAGSIGGKRCWSAKARKTRADRLYVRHSAKLLALYIAGSIGQRVYENRLKELRAKRQERLERVNYVSEG